MTKTNEWKEEKDESIKLQNIDVFKLFCKEEFKMYRALPHMGYVLLNENEEHTAQDDPYSEPYSVKHYYQNAYLTPNYNFDNFPYIAVKRSEADEKYIF